jgi:hypothetical protein
VEGLHHAPVEDEREVRQLRLERRLKVAGREAELGEDEAVDVCRRNVDAVVDRYGRKSHSHME